MSRPSLSMALVHGVMSRLAVCQLRPSFFSSAFSALRQRLSAWSFSFGLWNIFLSAYPYLSVVAATFDNRQRVISLLTNFYSSTFNPGCVESYGWHRLTEICLFCINSPARGSFLGGQEVIAFSAFAVSSLFICFVPKIPLMNPMSINFPHLTYVFECLCPLAPCLLYETFLQTSVF